MNAELKFLDTTLRDGDHATRHAFTREQVIGVAKGLEAAGVHYMEIGHGDGLGGSSIQYGRSVHDEFELIGAVAEHLHNTRLTVVVIPGIGTKEELKRAIDLGAGTARIATHCTEADLGQQHIALAKEAGLEAMALLMMAHTQPPAVILEQAKLCESYGADYVYILDSAGAMLPEQVRERIQPMREQLGTKIGFHAHNNLSMAIANTVEAIECGVDIVDGTLRGLGAGAGNAQLEVLISVLHKMNVETDVNEYMLMDTAEDVVAPLMQHSLQIDKAALLLGHAGVYSTFLVHAYRAAEKYDVPVGDILVEVGRRGAVGGQEDMIIEVALELAGKE
jgi:4-hydroxy-2-oxovalerate aldolase